MILDNDSGVSLFPIFDNHISSNTSSRLGSQQVNHSNKQHSINYLHNPYGIIIKDSKIHGKGAYATKPLSVGWLGRYAPDVEFLTVEEADKLPHNQQDYLLKVKGPNGLPSYLNGEDSKDYSVFINHSWKKDNVELDEEGEIFIKKSIPKATIARPVELLLNYGYNYWWDKILRQPLLGEMSNARKRWLEIIIPDDRRSMSSKDQKIYSDWHELRKTPYYVQKIQPLKSKVNSCPASTPPQSPVLTEWKDEGNLPEQGPIPGGPRHCFPTYKRVTLNITSFGPLHDPTKGRFSRVMKTINTLLRTHDIVYLQETRLTSQDQIKILRTYFDGCHLIGSVSDTTPAQAGVLIIIKNTVTRHYDINSTYASITPLGKGRIVSVSFTPKTDHISTLFSFRETCLYLKSGTGKGDNSLSPQDERQAVVQELCSIPRDTHISFLGGDINQHDNKTLLPLLTACAMEEVEQDINTFYRMEKESIAATRIDRWYCNISAAQASIVTPTCRVLTGVTGTVGRYCSGKLKDLDYIPTAHTKEAKHITDHVPLGLYLPNPGEGGNANGIEYIPEWVTKQPLFKDIITKNWNSDFREEDFFKKLEELTKLIYRASKITKHTMGANKPTVRHPTWKTALNTFRTLHKTNDQQKIILAAQEDSTVLKLLESFLESGDKVQSSTMLRDYLDQHINDVNVHSPINLTDRISRVERLSKAFPTQCARVTSLKDEGRTETEDPTEMAKITKSFWEKHYCLKQLTVTKLRRFGKDTIKINSFRFPRRKLLLTWLSRRSWRAVLLPRVRTIFLSVLTGRLLGLLPRCFMVLLCSL